MSSPRRAKILTLTELLSLREAARQDGRTVVQCHGCFDIVHPGHIRHLRFAKAQGDLLLVSITGDAEISKGDGRPLIPQELRAENLAELDCVDWVYIDPRPTAATLLCDVQPDVFIKGREYELNRDPRFAAERAAVEAAGGRVVFSSGDVVFSSTALIAAMEAQTDPFHRRLCQLAQQPDLAQGELELLFSAFRGRKVAVIGELLQETYVFCDQPEVADDSPVMSLRPIRHQYFDGGAAIVARHLAALGASPTLVTVLPDTELARAVERRLVASGVEVRALRATGALAERQRLLVGSTKLMKLDLVDALVLDARQREQLLDMALGLVEESGGLDAAIIVDAGLGLFSPAATQRLCRTIRDGVGILAGTVSGRRADLRSLQQLDLLTTTEPQLREAYRNFGDGLPAVTWELFEETQSRAALVSLGDEGLIAFNRLPQAASEGWQSRLKGEHIPSLIASPIDTLGCHEAMLAVSTLTLATGGSLLAAGFVGAVGASLHARQLGNPPLELSQLRRETARVLASRITYAHHEPDVVARIASPMMGSQRNAS
jgi:rfaE bifunctional protein nucleotidyltransferase chain/domain